MNAEKNLKEAAQKAADAKTETEKIKAAINRQENQLAVELQADAALQKLKSERGEIAADMAMGVDRSNELKKLDEEIKQARSNADVLPPIRETLAALEHKRDNAEAAERAAKHNLNYSVCEYLLEKAEQVGAEYAATAEKLIGLFKKLQGINHFLERRGYGIGYSNNHANLSLPIFRLDNHNPLRGGAFDYLHAGALLCNDSWSGEIEAIRAELICLGVDSSQVEG